MDLQLLSLDPPLLEFYRVDTALHSGSGASIHPRRLLGRRRHWLENARFN